VASRRVFVPCAALAGLALAWMPLTAESVEALIRTARVLAPDRIRIELTTPIDDLRPDNFRLVESSAPDVPLPIREVRRGESNRLVVVVGRRISASGSYRLEIREPAAAREMRPSRWAVLLTVVVSSALINNFVFSRFLGLCIFFGVSKKRETALGMGATFLFVMIATAMLSWALYMWVLHPLHLAFLQVIVFIGVVAVLVQFLDTALKRTQPSLYRKFGIYLVLITTNCIILAVPLLNAAAGSGPAEAFALALGSGAGFALALFLMSCAREHVELARVPKVFQGLPVAFLLAGLFALAFSGFAGMSFLE
jgi:electron transport complex protein RnfA